MFTLDRGERLRNSVRNAGYTVDFPSPSTARDSVLWLSRPSALAKARKPEYCSPLSRGRGAMACLK